MADLNFPSNPQIGDTYVIGIRTWVWNGSGWQLQSGIVSTNPFTVVTAYVTSGTNSTSTDTGALRVVGGVGIGKDVTVGGNINVYHTATVGNLVTTGTIYGAAIYDTNARVVTTATIGNFGITNLSAGTDTAVSSSTGVVVVWSTATLQSITSRSPTTDQAITITNPTESWSSSTGALVVNGGIGVGGSINVAHTGSIEHLVVGDGYIRDLHANTVIIDAILTSTNTLETNGTTSGAVIVKGGVGIGKSLQVGNTIYAPYSVITSSTVADLTVTNTTVILGNTDSIDTSTGALTIAGGVGISKNVNIGGVLNVANTSYIHGSRILVASDLETVSTTATFITNDPTSQVGLAAIAGTTTTYGTYNFGDVNSIINVNDYNTGTNTGFYSINDAATAPGYVVYIGFTNVTNFTRLVLNLNYTANSGHTVEIDLYNFVTAGWDAFTTYSGSPGWTQFILETFDDTPYISSGKTYARLYHSSTGNTAHRTWIDYAVLQDSLQGGQGPRGATGAQGIQGPQGLTTSTTSTFIFFNTTNSTSTATGSVVVLGGVGIAKDVYIGGSLYGNALYDLGSRVITQATLGNYGVSNITAGTDTAISTSTGAVVIWNTSTLQSITDKGFTTSNRINITDITDSNTSTQGALTVAGGAGVGRNLIVGGNAQVYGNLQVYGSTTYVDTTNTYVTDPMLELGGGVDGAQLAVNDGLDRGLVLHYSTTATSNTAYSNNAFLGMDNATQTLLFKTNVFPGVPFGNVNGFLNLGDWGNARFGSLRLESTTNASSTNSGALIVAGGIGANGNLNISGTISAGASATFNGIAPVISLTDTNSLNPLHQINFKDGNLVTRFSIKSTSSVATLETDGLPRISISSGSVAILNTAVATSTSTGALQVFGGVGVRGDLYAQNIYSNGSQVLTLASLGSAGVTSILAGTDTAISTTTGQVTIWNTSTLQTITSRGSTSNQIITLTNGLDSTGPNTGTLVVTGGVGVSGRIYAGELYDNSSRVITIATSPLHVVTEIQPGADISVNTGKGIVVVSGTGTFQTITARGSSTDQALLLTNLTNASNTNTGALVVNGGVGVGKDLYIGGNLSLNGTQTWYGTTGSLSLSLTTSTWNFVPANSQNISFGSTSTFVGINTSSPTVALDVFGDIEGFNIYSNGAQVLTTSTIGSYGVSKITTGSGIVVTPDTGVGIVNIQSIDSLQAVTDRGFTTTNAITISSFVTATSTTTGALKVVGGVGIGGDLYVAGKIYGMPTYIENSAAVGSVNTANYWIKCLTFALPNIGDSCTVKFKSGIKVFGSPTYSDNSEQDIIWMQYTRDTATTLLGTTYWTNESSESAISASSLNHSVTYSTSTGVVEYWRRSTVAGGRAFTLITETYPDGASIQAKLPTVVTNASWVSAVTSLGTSVTVDDIDTYTWEDITVTGTLNHTGTAGNLLNNTSAGTLNLGAGATLAATTKTLNIGNNGVATSIANINIGSIVAGALGATVIGGTLTQFVSTTAAVSTNTGAVQIAGGLGVGGALYAGGAIYSGGVQVLTTETDTLQSVTNRGATTNQAISITNATDSTTSTNGALSIAGGLGVAKSAIIGGNATVYGNLQVFGTQTFVNSTQTYVIDPVIELGGGVGNTSLAVNDGFDRGLVLHYSTTATSNTAWDNHAFLGMDNTTQTLVYKTNVYPGGTQVYNPSFSSTGTFGPAKFGSLTLTAGTAATSTGTGALIVSGGVGINGDLYAGNMYSNGLQVLTTSSLGSGGVGVSTITAGTDTAVSGNFGAITIWGTSTLQSVTSRGATSTNPITINNGTNATTTGTGALIISGGGGGIGVGGSVVASQLKAVNSANTGSSRYDIRAENGNNTLNIIANTAGGNYNPITQTGDSLIYWTQGGQGSGALVLAPWSSTSTGIRINNLGVVTLPSLVAATNTTTGALIVGGGVGIGQDLFVGGYQIIGGSSTITNNLQVLGTTNATSTATGALQVRGGVGIATDLWVGGNTAVFGTGASSRGITTGVKVFSNGAFATTGDAQSSKYILRVSNASALNTALTTNNGIAGTTNQVVLPDNSSFAFKMMVVARSTTSSDEGAWEFNGVISRYAGVGTTILRVLNKTKIWSSIASWDVNVSADTTNGLLSITGKGDGSNTVRFVATVDTTEVTN